MRLVSLLLIVLLASGIAPRLTAQGAISPRASTNRPIISGGFGPAGSLISEKSNAPFSAVALERFDQTLNDGTNISRKNQVIIMRDSEGRVYRGRELKRLGSGESERLVIFTITDPIKHIQLHCTVVTKHCSETEYKLPRRRYGFPQPKHLPDVTTEELGDSNISGVQVVGRRITRVIPEGSAGNDRPFDTTEEIWHSKDLDIDIQVKRIDPRFGIRETTLTDVNLVEPDPRFFQVPEGYKVGPLIQPGGAMAPLPASGLPAIPSIAPGIP